jgi:hypothetical protein
MRKPALSFLLGLVALLLPFISWAGNPALPFQINNASPFADTDLYVAIVGIDMNDNHVWINPTNSQVLPMSSSYNTVTGPTYSGNTGPGANSKYAACFSKLSTIPNKTFNLPYIKGCRVYISKGQQLYFYFFGSNGAPSGYSGPDPQNPTDPNQGITYEIIELTNDANGIFCNTTRVDAFHYPMGLELFGGGGYYRKTGELKTAAQIVAAYQANVPAEFQSLANTTTNTISCPGKSPAFQPGGAQGAYFNSYIDAIWNKYKTTDLIFYAGNAGVFKGRVDANNRMVLVGQSGAWAGHTGIIPSKPTMLDMLEARGALATGVADVTVDLVVQTQVAAAINRHIIDVTTATPGQQDFYNAATYFQAAPMNYYARFWHLPGISVDNFSYGFAYDDVNDQSSTLQNNAPTKVLATWGGFAGTVTTPQAIPGKIEAESFTAQSGTQTETTTDTGGGINVDWYETGDWLDYSVNVATAGTYTAQFRVASANGGATLQLRNSGGTVLGSINVGNTGGWQSWQTISTNVTLPAGTQTLRLYASASTGCNVNWLNFVSASSPAFSVTLQAEAANVNNGMTVETCTDTGGGQDMGFVDAGDYLVWNNITFPTTGTYTIEYRVASGAAGGTISADLNAGTIQFGNTTIPGTGGWQNWTTVSKNVTINAGTYNFGIFAQSAGWNINWVRISKAAGARTALATANEQLASQLSLYPNPVAEQLQLDTAPALAGSSYRLLNALGQAVGSGKLANTLNVANLPAGLYQLVVTTAEKQTITKRFTKL